MTVNISKKVLVRIGVAIAIVSVIAILIGSLASSKKGIAQQEQTTEAEAAAAQAISEVLRFDYTEGQEAWAERIEPFCTPVGLMFWDGPIADQVWPMLMEKQYVTQNIEVLDTKVVDEGNWPNTLLIEVTLEIEYTVGENSEPIREETTNTVMMVQHDGQWLMDVPPEQASSETKEM